MSILRYFNNAKPSEVFISVANEEKEKTVNSMDLTRNEVTNVKSQLEKAESFESGNRKPYEQKLEKKYISMEFQVFSNILLENTQI